MSLQRTASRILLLLSLFGLSACQAAPAPVAEVTPTAMPLESSAAASPQPQPTPLPTPTATPLPVPQICSPLEGYTLEQLREQISNDYHPPAAGSDDPHQGIDFADFNPADKIAVTGMPVLAATDGTVAAVLKDRFPYGNAVMVEVPLAGWDPAWVAGLQLPEALPELRSGGALTCPEPPTLPADRSQRSLYILYAHLLEAPQVIPGQAVSCGQTLGKVGQSGNALSPHLHIEVRVGPAGMQWDSLAHYDVSASPAEMGAYCLWRVSGAFQTINPLCVLVGCPSDALSLQ